LLAPFVALSFVGAWPGALATLEEAQLAASGGGGPISQVEAQIAGRTFGCRGLELFHRQLQLVTIQPFSLLAELGVSPSQSTAYSGIPRSLSLTFYYYIIV
jgi:hypothetical protein